MKKEHYGNRECGDFCFPLDFLVTNYVFLNKSLYFAEIVFSFESKYSSNLFQKILIISLIWKAAKINIPQITYIFTMWWEITIRAGLKTLGSTAGIPLLQGDML